MIPIQVFCLKLLDLETHALSTKHRHNNCSIFSYYVSLRKKAKLQLHSLKRITNPLLHWHAAHVLTSSFVRNTAAIFIRKKGKKEIISLIPKFNRALAKEAVNQGSPQNTSHSPEGSSRFLRLSRQVDLETAH